MENSINQSNRNESNWIQLSIIELLERFTNRSIEGGCVPVILIDRWRHICCFCWWIETWSTLLWRRQTKAWRQRASMNVHHVRNDLSRTLPSFPSILEHLIISLTFTKILQPLQNVLKNPGTCQRVPKSSQEKNSQKSQGIFKNLQKSQRILNRNLF